MMLSRKIVLLAGASVMALGMSLAAPQVAQAQTACGSGTGPVGGSCTGPFTFTGNGGDLAVNSGVQITAGNTGIVNNVSMGTLTNDGTISGTHLGVYNITGANTSGTIASLVNNGTISGQVAITNGGTIGALTNSGSISGSAAAINNSGSLGAITNSGVISGNIVNSSSQDLTINGPTDATYGTLTGYASGSSGTINNTSSNVVFGAGNIYLNDDINVGGNTVYNRGATLKINGTRTITGNYSQNGGGLVISAVAGVSSTALIVTGNAAVSNATVTISGTGLVAGQNFIVVHPSGTGTYSGNQAAVSGTNYLSGTISAVGNDLVVSLQNCGTCGPAVPAEPVYGGNYGVLDTVLQRLLLSGAQSQLINLYGRMPADDKPLLLGQLLPSPTASPSAGVQTSGQLNDLVMGAISGRLAMAGEAGVAAGSGYRDSSVWGRVLGGTATRDSTGDTAGYGTSTWGLVFGADTQVTPEVLVGGALSWARAWSNGLDIAAGTGNTVDSYQLTAYTTWAHGPWTVNGMAGLGLNNNEESRNIFLLGETAHAKYYGRQYTLESDVGYGVPLGGATITPTAGMKWLRVDTGAYTETGAPDANLSIAASSQDQVESALGAKVAYPVNTPVGRMTPEIKAAWLHDFINGNVATTASLGGVSFQTTAPLPTADGAAVGAGVTLAANDTVSVKVEYTGQFRPDYTAHNGMLEVKTKF